MENEDEAGPGAVLPVEPEQEIDLKQHPSGIKPQLQNVVATVNLGCKLDLKQIAMHARNAEYNPKRFAAVIMRIRDPKTTALIFASGKMVCTGAKDEEQARTAGRKYARIVQKLGFSEVSFSEFKIQNIVGSCDVKFPIKLEGLAISHHMFASYEPELFPGLIYRMKVPKIVLLIFVSGKVVLTGAKKREEIYEAFELIYHILCEFRKGNVAATLPSGPMAAGPSTSTDIQKSGKQASMAARTPSMGLSHFPSLNPPTPAHQLPPPTPSRHGSMLPPATPMHQMPPPTPSHHGSMLPPPTPVHSSRYPQAPTPRELPPATPHR